MLKNLSRSLIATAFALSAAAGAARASGNSIDELEAGNPHSVNYASRPVPRKALTNDALNALESGNPDSVDYARRSAPRAATNEEISSLESGNPDSADSASSTSKQRSDAVAAAAGQR